MLNMIQAACFSHVGKVRSNNEDNFYFNNMYMPVDNYGTPMVESYVRSLKSGTSFAIFDGMGGGDFGELASYTAAQAMEELLSKGPEFAAANEFLQYICLDLNRRVFEKGAEIHNFRMGSTVVGLYFEKGFAYSFNLGDSKLFCLREKELIQISNDHTDEQYLKEKGITNRKPRLTQHLGINPAELQLEPCIKQFQYKRGDQYLLCSDGLTDMLKNSEIRELLLTERNVKTSVSHLIRRALEQGGRDNVTVILCKIH